MPLNNPFLVPINVEAFAVNTAVLESRDIQIRRWEYDYTALKQFSSPLPKTFTGTNDLPGTGVILHWTLPDVLRRGSQTNDGNVVFPLVPNRWLVVRYSGPLTKRTAVAWIVESDKLGNNDRVKGGAAYLQPDADIVQPTSIGQVVALENWTEPDPPNLFLSAVAPGNSSFAAFQPYCWNVLSMYDPLDAVAEQDSLSYFVAGWFSKPDADITGSWQANSNFDKFLEQASWTRADDGTDTATQSIYHGMSWGLEWNIKGPAISNAPKPADIKVALGNTTTEALTSFIKVQAPNVDAALLEALQYDLLPDFDRSDADYELKQHIEASWFGAHDGGDRWEFVTKSVDPSIGDPPPPLSSTQLQEEKTWLTGLNRLQADYDEVVRNLGPMQWKLYQTWWKYNNLLTNKINPFPRGTSEQQFKDALDPNNPASLVLKVHGQIESIGSKQSGIQAYIATYNGPATRELKQYAGRPYHFAYDPVILMNGLKNDGTLAPVDALPCRFMKDIITGFKHASRTITATEVQPLLTTLPNIATLPAQLPQLLLEFFLLDPMNATMITFLIYNSTEPALINAVAGSMAGGQNRMEGNYTPAFGLLQWKQPWSPLVMQWNIVYYPIDYDEGDKNCWTFDGNDYVWTGKGSAGNTNTVELDTTTFITPKAGYNFRVQIEKYMTEHPDDADMKALQDILGQTDHWDFLSQSLSSLSPLLTLRNPNPNMSASIEQQLLFPGFTLDKLIGNAGYYPMPGSVTSTSIPSKFQPWRAGQFRIQQLSVIDAFGQTCDVVTGATARQFAPILSPALQPTKTVMPGDPQRFIQLTPRLLQAGRLNMKFVPPIGYGTNPSTADDENPIVAFLLHNYLDESIACYDRDGLILGSVWIITNAQQQQEVNWFAAPGSSIANIEDLINNPALPSVNDLGMILREMKRIGPPAFLSMLQTLDQANFSIHGNMTTADTGMLLLAGQPIAMARLQLQFELEQDALTDPSWENTFKLAYNPVTNWDFSIRLGESGQRSDGLLGYFCKESYTVFYAPTVPTSIPDPAYILPVGNGDSVKASFSENVANYVTVLMDPRSLVHATTGIVPVSSINISQEYINDAFTRIDLSFEVGPLLTDIVDPADTPREVIDPYVVMPHPVLKNGEWSWQQLEGDKWKTYEIRPAIATARFNNISPVIRQGVLRLTGAIKINNT